MSEEALLKEIFSDKLRALLDENKMNQSELAEMLGVSESTVGKWLLKKALPRMGVIEKLSVIFGRKKSYFLEDMVPDKQAYYFDHKTAQIAQNIFDNKELGLLFDASRKLKPDELMNVKNLVEMMVKRERGDDD